MNLNSKEIFILHDDRPWGSFDQFTHNQPSTIKIITVQAGQATSLQCHTERTEHWIVISGTGRLYIGEQIIEAQTGVLYEVLPTVQHRIENIAQFTGESFRVLEISTGNFDEKDIVRLDDRYGRVDTTHI